MELEELQQKTKDFIQNLIAGNAKNEKDEEKEKVENEDKRKIIDEVGGILKDKVDEEVWRTIIGKLEKLSYEPSETDKADNKKCKNEDEEEEKEEKFEEEKEIANKKCKNEEKEEDKKEKVENSMETRKEIILGGSTQTQIKSSYISQEERLKAGENY